MKYVSRQATDCKNTPLFRYSQGLANSLPLQVGKISSSIFLFFLQVHDDNSRVYLLGVTRSLADLWTLSMIAS